MRRKLHFTITPALLSEARWHIDTMISERSVEHSIAAILAERDHWKAIAEARLQCANQNLRQRRGAEEEAVLTYSLLVQQADKIKALRGERDRLYAKLSEARRIMRQTYRYLTRWWRRPLFT